MADQMNGYQVRTMVCSSLTTWNVVVDVDIFSIIVFIAIAAVTVLIETQ